MRKLDDPMQLSFRFDVASKTETESAAHEPKQDQRSVILDFSHALTRRRELRQKETERELLRSIHESIKHLG